MADVFIIHLFLQAQNHGTGGQSILVSSTLLGPMATYCFSFEISWGALCDERASFRDGVKERRTKGYC